MKRPEVTLENQAVVYDYYKNHTQNRIASKLLHKTLGAIFAPRITYDDDAEEQIGTILRNNGSVVLAMNHTKAIDPCVVAALPARHKTLRPLIGNTFIPSKKSIFKNPAVRLAVDELGAVPVFRAKDVEVGKDTPAITPRSALTGFLKTCVAKLNDGQNMAIFPEGTRNNGDVTKIQELQGGVGLMVCRVSDVPQPPIIPIGIHYSEGLMGPRNPALFIGKPSSLPFAKADNVMEWLQPQLQSCVDRAVEL